VKRAWRNSCSDCNATKPKYKCMQNFQDAWYSTDTDMKNFAPWLFLSVLSSKSTALLPDDHDNRERFYERLRARLQILPDVCSRMRFNLPEIYYRDKEFALCGTRRFTPNNTVPFSTANFFNACCGLLNNNLTDHMLSRDVITAPYGRNFQEYK
jgi:hypothetical protein